MNVERVLYNNYHLLEFSVHMRVFVLVVVSSCFHFLQFRRVEEYTL